VLRAAGRLLQRSSAINAQMPAKKPSKKKQGLQKKESSRKKVAPLKKASIKKKIPTRAQRSRQLLRTVRRARPIVFKERPHQLTRHDNNPIIEPREGNYWEMKATFNPGAIYADHRVHLLYRAIGGDDVSVLGYASSGDGVSFVERPGHPAYVPATTKTTTPKEAQVPLEPAYFSGGGWNGGCEDPRLTLLDGRVYLTYTAFDGWGSIRIALSSIDLEDFLNKNWKWKKPAMISPSHGIHKNWSVFSEKINGKFAILHGISPDIMVEYRDSLDFEDGEYIDSKRPPYGQQRMRMGVWDTWIRGAGPPPLKTKDGWLLLYHAMDLNDPNRYKLGAMLLDGNDPTKVLYRSQTPILEPDLPYENEGFKSGVVYACGAVITEGKLFVYYGGADSVTCVAMADIDTFLNELKTYGRPRLTSENKSNPRTNGRS
jgi:predicted GH43/DUF377 family glycosyl hydrolase